MQIVVLDGYALNPGDLSWDALKEFGTLSVYDRTPAEFTAQRLAGADIAFTNKTRIGARELERAVNLQYVGVLATGYDVLDLTALKTRGVAATNVPGYATGAVAQLTMALLLEICHNVGHHNNQVHKGRWSYCADYCFWDYPLIELAGMTFGVLGTGATGCAVAKLAKAFGMRVIGTSPHKRKNFPGDYVPLETLLATSDVLSLHCPANETSVRIINADTLSQMKDGAILLNTARGALLDEVAVAEALSNGKLYALGVDVAEREPIPRSSPLLSAPNCLITPHIAWAPVKARQRLMDGVLDNLRAFLAGESLNRLV